MAYPYPQFYGGQPWQYQDQLNQLRSAPAPGGGLNWVQSHGLLPLALPSC